MKPKVILSLLLSTILLTSNAQALLRSRLRDRRGSTDTYLEQLIPIEEALNLVKAEEGKGYFQIAMRYAQGAELPKDKHAAYKMLCKACDLNYANAILVEGLLDEAYLVDKQGAMIYPPNLSVIKAYFGGDINNGRNGYDLITNEVAFVRIMRKYEKARDLGALVATNQIAALNKRLTDFRQQESEAAAKTRVACENNRRLSAILGEEVHRSSIADDDTVKERLSREREREALRESLAKLQDELKNSHEVQNKSERNAARERYNAALKSLTGFEMGQIVDDTLPLSEGRKLTNLQRPYRCFDSCNLVYADRRLLSIELISDSKSKFLSSSLSTEVNSIKEDIMRNFGLDNRPLDFVQDKADTWKCQVDGWLFTVTVNSDHDGIIVSFKDAFLSTNLHNKLQESRDSDNIAPPVFNKNK